MVDGDELDGLARNVLRTLWGADPAMLHTFAAGLKVAGGPTARLAFPLSSYARCLDRGETESRLVELQLRVVLQDLALPQVGGELIGRLATAETPFWRAVGDALAELAEDRLEAV